MTLKMYEFTKKERLNSKKNIARLFEQGTSFFTYPFKVYYHLDTAAIETPAAAVLFSIGKKQFKKAVDRNRVKRLCREAYRLNKYLLLNPLQENKSTLEVAFIYVGKTIPDYHELESKLQKILSQLAAIIQK